MAKIKGFLKYKRQDVPRRPVETRIHDFSETDIPLPPEQMHQQSARCIDCGIPFCHGSGCPLYNNIPEMNEFVYTGRWDLACKLIHMTNNFPEITGKVCPAPCETACTLAINDKPVLIKHIEMQIAEKGFQKGWIKPLPPKNKTGKKVAVVGSGPSGLATAQQLVRSGHNVVVFEKSDSIGGLLRYGIPDFKLEKSIIDRRVSQMKAEGVDFQTQVNVGTDISAHYLRRMFDCVCLTAGAGVPRDINVPGRDSGNIFFAMDFLTSQNKQVAGSPPGDGKLISAKDKVVVVIGGGDTGSDCVGTSRRQGAKKIYQLEILPKPPENRPTDTPWPMWPRIMRTSSSHEEGCERMWSVVTKSFTGTKETVKQLHCCKVEWLKEDGKWKFKEVQGSEFSIKADIVLLAMGFLHVSHTGLVEEIGLALDNSGNIAVDDFQTSDPAFFAAGDAVSGPSLVVRAINSGRGAAKAIDKWLSKKTDQLQ